MTTHTPGPWAFVPDADGSRSWNFDVYSPAMDESIARVGYFDTDLDEDEANTRLIAAAPDLLEALEGLLSYDRVVRPAFRSRPVGAPDSMARIDQDTLIRLEDKARAAIAKARGEG